MLILCAAVTLWVGGFDVLYACQDIEYDKSAGLFSVPNVRHRPGAYHRPRHARRNDRAAGLAGVEFSFAMACLGGNRRGGRAARLRAFTGFAKRSQPA